MKNTCTKFLAAVVLAGICLFAATPAAARPRHHGPGPRFGGPVYYGGPRHHHHHHHHGGPSRGWYNGALVVGATLGVLDILTRPTTTTTTTYVQPQPQVVYQQPTTTYVYPQPQPQVIYQQPATTVVAPTPVYYPQPAPVVQQTIWR